MAAPQTRQPIPRWPIAVAGIVVQLILGTVYAWSVFKKPLMEAHGWSASHVTTTFSLMILFLGISAAFGGRFVDRAGARTVASTSAVLFGIATILAGVGDSLGNIWILWIGYGVIGGIGNGLGYITPIAVLVRWFPERKGLITGLAVMGFGFGAAITGQIAPILIKQLGIAPTFYISGVLFLVIMFLAAQKLVNPPKDWVAPAPVRKKAAGSDHSVVLSQACGMYQFYVLWGILFLNVTAGIGLVSNLSPMAQKQAGLSAIAAGSFVFACSLFNGLGRIGWAAVSDRIGREWCFFLILGTQIPIFLLLPYIANVWLFGAMCCYVLACYGGGFSCMPAFAADTFGSKNIGSIYGPILLAWGAAGVVGPIVMEGAMKRAAGNFGAALQISAVLLAVGLALALTYRRPIYALAATEAETVPVVSSEEA